MDRIREMITASIETKQRVLQSETLLQTISTVVDELVNALQNGRRIYFCGNGGSAADAQHLAAEFSGRF